MHIFHFIFALLFFRVITVNLYCLAEFGFRPAKTLLSYRRTIEIFILETSILRSQWRFNKSGTKTFYYKARHSLISEESTFSAAFNGVNKTSNYKSGHCYRGMGADIPHT